MRIRSVKVNKGLISIVYEERSKRNEKEFDKFTVSSKDKALPDFYTSFSRMAAEAGKIVGVKGSDTNEIIPISLVMTYSYTAAATAAVSCVRLIDSKYGSEEFKFSAPPIDPKHYQTLEAIIAAAERYVSGDRAQMELIVEQPSDEKAKLVEDAKRIVLETKRATTAMIQRRLRVSYTAATEILDALHIQGVVSAPDENGAREVLITDAA